MVDVLFRGIENVVVIHEANDATFSSDVRTTGPEGVRVSAVGKTDVHRVSECSVLSV